MRLQVITNSELMAFRACPFRHSLVYHDRLRPQIAAAPLRAGDMMHKGIEAGWRAAWVEPNESPEQRAERAIPAALDAITTQHQAFVESVKGHEREHELQDEALEACETMHWA
ncbi:MAG TPA: PD-(D/E)XK nuclease family protein, partial [Acidobacteriota bacterium]|nr:PD-(D/E)XK nuclease family protein [Acidobacteriota bacterium]